MLELDEDVYAELLGRHAWSEVVRTTAVTAAKYQPKGRALPRLSSKTLDALLRPDQPRSKQSRAAYMKAWRAANPEKHRANLKKYAGSAKGKAVKAKTWARYYAKNRARILAARSTPEGRSKQAEADARYRARHAAVLAARARARRAAKKGAAP